MRPPIPFKPWRNHHLYHGIAFFIFGLYNYVLMLKSNELLGAKSLWISCMIFGLLLAIDDIIEHTKTRDTPIRILFEKYLLPHLHK